MRSAGITVTVKDVQDLFERVHSRYARLALFAPRAIRADVDLLRKAKIAVAAGMRPRPFAGDIFPDPPRADYFQPEPRHARPQGVSGCAEWLTTDSWLWRQ